MGEDEGISGVNSFNSKMLVVSIVLLYRREGWGGWVVGS